MNNKESVLQEAERIVNGPRAVTHGAFDSNFNTASQIFTSWTGVKITPAQVCQVLIALKMARFNHNPQFRDNLVDMAGYIELLHRLTEIA